MGRDQEKIRARAYDIWDRDGRQEGRDQDYWLQAERELSASGADAAPSTDGSIAAEAAGESASMAAEASAPAKAKKANGAAKAVAAKAAPRKRRGAQPQSQA